MDGSAIGQWPCTCGRTEAWKVTKFSATISGSPSPTISLKFYHPYKTAKNEVELIMSGRKRSVLQYFTWIVILHPSTIINLDSELFFQKLSHHLHLSFRRITFRRYYCDKIKSCWIVLKILSSTCTWIFIEETFGIKSLALSKMFWDTIEQFHDTCVRPVTNIKHDFSGRGHKCMPRAWSLRDLRCKGVLILYTVLTYAWTDQ